MLIRHLYLDNLFSYADAGAAIELDSLNVLIGPNASGKSNLIECIRLLRASASDLAGAISSCGGIDEVLNKQSHVTKAWMGIDLNYPQNKEVVRHGFKLRSLAARPDVSDESLVTMGREGPSNPNPTFYYQQTGASGSIASRVLQPIGGGFDPENGSDMAVTWDEKPVTGLKPGQSILSQRYDPDSYPVLSYVADSYKAIKIYDQIVTRGNSAVVQPQPTDLPSDFLLEDGSNLGLIINDLHHRGLAGDLVSRLQSAYPQAEEITYRIQGGTIQTFIREKGLRTPTPATRLSDGTLRYLCLLTILLHPEPPPLICIEEPEVGLHPDLIADLAELLVEASQRTQLIVTTHSDLLISALGGQPQAVIVCERDDQGSHLRRLDPEKLRKWLKDYSLGDLWRSGEIGGVRY